MKQRLLFCILLFRSGRDSDVPDGAEMFDPVRTLQCFPARETLLFLMFPPLKTAGGFAGAVSKPHLRWHSGHIAAFSFLLIFSSSIDTGLSTG